ncbi:hypothetical protein DYB26_013976 [Aphanomyces astaci]|uniref:Uncharacterized protein n=1 Tax=Aphanomyces astaci TaxID=112090 RepID=A0A418FWQ5_APHAT|nr:hypothetical protein DYB26_013976 [Aphanomyces astaci]
MNAPPKPPPTPVPPVDPVAVQTALDKKLKQRLYIRKMMRIYRDEHRQSREHLIKRIHELSAHMAELVRRASAREESSTLLSWREVSHAMREGVHVSSGETKRLQNQVDVYRGLVDHLYRWIASCEHVTVSLSPTAPSWRMATLLAEPQSRRLGKEWITRQLYHNTGRMFQNFPLSPSEELSAIDVTFHEGLINISVHRQVTLAASPHQVLDLYRHHLVDVLMADQFGNAPIESLAESTDTTVLHQAVVPQSGEFMSLLGGEFHEGPDKTVFVVQQIVDDETQPDHHHTRRQRNRMAELRPQSVGGGTHVKYAGVSTQSFNQGRYFTLDEEASSVGLDLTACPEVDKEEQLKLHLTRLVLQKRPRCRHRASEILKGG